MISKIKDNISKELIIQIAVIVLLVVIASTNTVFATEAADNAYATNLSDWIMSGVKVIALAVVATFAIKFLLKRQMVQFISFIVLAGFILVIIYNPMKLKDIGDYLWGVVFG